MKDINMDWEYLSQMLQAQNFVDSKEGHLISNDGRIKIELYEEGGFGSYYDNVWWEEAQFIDDVERRNFDLLELTFEVVEAFGYSPY